MPWQEAMLQGVYRDRYFIKTNKKITSKPLTASGANQDNFEGSSSVRFSFVGMRNRDPHRKIAGLILQNENVNVNTSQVASYAFEGVKDTIKEIRWMGNGE